MKKIFAIIAAVGMAAALSSCLGEVDESKNTCTLYGYCTVVGSNPDYTLYFDGGGIVKPSVTTITNKLGVKGFDNYERALLYMSFLQGDVQTDPLTNELKISNANIQAGSLIPLTNLMPIADAVDKKVFCDDSLHAISRISRAWGYRGFINTEINGAYTVDKGKGIEPTVNLVYDENSFSNNTANLTLCFNRHSEKNATAGGIETFLNSYPISDFADLIPGNDSVTFTIKAEGQKDPVSFKIGREDFKRRK